MVGSVESFLNMTGEIEKIEQNHSIYVNLLPSDLRYYFLF